jgi:hypothetical protein
MQASSQTDFPGLIKPGRGQTNPCDQTRPKSGLLRPRIYLDTMQINLETGFTNSAEQSCSRKELRCVHLSEFQKENYPKK